MNYTGGTDCNVKQRVLSDGGDSCLITLNNSNYFTIQVGISSPNCHDKQPFVLLLLWHCHVFPSDALGAVTQNGQKAQQDEEVTCAVWSLWRG